RRAIPIETRKTSSHSSRRRTSPREVSAFEIAHLSGGREPLPIVSQSSIRANRDQGTTTRKSSLLGLRHNSVSSGNAGLWEWDESSRRFFAARKNPCFARALHLQYRDMKRPLCVAVLSALLSTNIVAQSPTAAPSPEQPPADYDLRWSVKIPMRDKVELNATLYLPKTPNGSPPKTPVIFTLTPYISDTYHARGAYFASHGYAF